MNLVLSPWRRFPSRPADSMREWLTPLGSSGLCMLPGVAIRQSGDKLLIELRSPGGDLVNSGSFLISRLADCDPDAVGEADLARVADYAIDFADRLVHEMGWPVTLKLSPRDTIRFAEAAGEHHEQAARAYHEAFVQVAEAFLLWTPPAWGALSPVEREHRVRTQALLALKQGVTLPCGHRLPENLSAMLAHGRVVTCGEAPGHYPTTLHRCNGEDIAWTEPSEPGQAVAVRDAGGRS